MKHLRATGLLALALTVTAIAQGPITNEPPNKPARRTVSEPAQTPPPPTPISITVVSPPKTAEERKLEAEDREADLAFKNQNTEMAKQLVWIGWGQVALSALALIASGFAVAVALATRKIAATDLEMAHRAYVSIGHLEIANLKANEAPRVTYRTFNGGATPAHVFETTCWLLVSGTLPVVPDRDAAQPPSSHYVLRGNHDLPGAFNSLRVLSGEEIDDMASKSKHLYVFVRVRYRDVFGRHRFSQSCYLLETEPQNRFAYVKAEGYNLAD